MNHLPWDWNVGEKVIADLSQWRNTFEWVEEPYVSPDGERIAAIVKIADAGMSVCENSALWENAFDKIWYLRFAPNNSPVALVSKGGLWTVARAGVPWVCWYEFVWDTRFSDRGNHIIAAAVSAGKYVVVTDGIPWEQGFPSLSHLTVSHDGENTAAVVQTVSFNPGDIFAFQKGCYTAAVNGKPWGANFLNVWEMSFSPDGRHLAAEARRTLFDYTIVVDGRPWDKEFPSVWKPQFNPADGSVSAPVKVSGGWTLARNGEIIWDERFFQLWHHRYSADGKHIAAIVSPKYGERTIAVDGRPWPVTFNNLVTGMAISPDGRRTACAARTNAQWRIAVDGKCWDGAYDMAWNPVFSPDSRHVAAKVEKNGRFFILVDNAPVKKEFTQVWDPVFSPDSGKLLVKAIGGGKNENRYARHVMDLSGLSG